MEKVIYQTAKNYEGYLAIDSRDLQFDSQCFMQNFFNKRCYDLTPQGCSKYKNPNYDKLPIETAVNLMNKLVEYVYSLLDDYSVEDGYDAEGIVANTINHFKDNDNMQIMIQSFLIKTESDYVRNRYL